MSNETKTAIMNYLPTIGLEIHAEMNTKSKMFCSCKNDPDETKPNTNICPICLGHPGTLPVLNFEAIKNVIRVGLAIDGHIADFTEWDRKNYFYPDIPKGYQISQYKYPLISNGKLANVEIERIHLEEDTAQSTHDTHSKSLVNFNRSGVPLMELVTKPVIHDAETAVNFAKELQLLLRYLNAGEANMEKGEMRVEANISVAKINKNAKEVILGTKTEVKNLNSFRSVERAIKYEIERQIELLERGEKVTQETRGWDDKNNETYSQRSKESSHDYRYFPDPDIPKLQISKIKELSSEILSKSLPELPWTKRSRLMKDYSLNEKEVSVFIDSPILADYYESIAKRFSNDQKKIKLVTNYFLSDYVSLLNNIIDQNLSKIDSYEKIIEEKSLGYILPEYFSELIEMISKNEISSRGAKEILSEMSKNKVGDKSPSPHSIATQKDLIQKSSEGDLIPVIEKIINENQKVVSEYKSGKIASLQFLIGQAMKATKGSANPEVLKKIFTEKMK